MVRPNYRDFRRSRFVLASGTCLEHSAKGSTWEDHKYIKKVDGTYYYPDSYEGGRHLDDEEKKNKYEQKDSYGVKLDEVEQGVYDYMKNNLPDVDPKTVSPETWQKFIKEYVKFVGGDPNNIPDDIIAKIQENVTKHYSEKEKNDEQTEKLTDNDINNLAKEVIRGNFGKGQQRKELLGENYSEVQKRVNELMKGSVGKKKVSKTGSSTAIEKAVNAASKVGKSAKRR